MKITRKLSLLGMFTATALTLAACGSDEPNVAAPSSTSSTSTSAPSSSTSTSATGSSAGTGSESSSSESSTASSPAAGGGETASFECAEGELRSSGSTAQGKVMEEWILAFNAKCNANVGAYQGGGSGKGISDFTGNQVDFAGSDSALKEDQAAAAKADRCAGADAVNLPMVTGPIALAYNVPGVTDLTLNASVLANIFNGTVTNWNDATIAELNSGVTLPDLTIQSVHRQEDSGTTENFTRYLKAAAGDAWTFDAAKAWAAPGGIAANGSDGVAQEVVGKEGTIGYVEWGYAADNSLAIAKIDNGSGAVELTGESAGKAVSAAEVVGTGNDVALKLDYATDEEGAYPIVLVTYEIVCSANNGDKLDILKAFLGYTATEGQEGLEELGAAPLPAEIQEKVIASIQALS
ncbi:phosphate ABC transporter substrate-binding protein PstS [Nakamurella deserti]|uniref:phosphate ABC transporter substrate-binding protein PstS n=1 Tax=Nakamurella deserti TaxID=2164074 RepID=UPI000DBE3A0E|nr:phosphate ABC transporter substrate-binding protein PstS [Nakamurella deserti]